MYFILLCMLNCPSMSSGCHKVQEIQIWNGKSKGISFCLLKCLYGLNIMCENNSFVCFFITFLTP